MNSRTTLDLSRPSLAQIEYEARRLRAQTLAQAGSAVRQAVVRFFTTRTPIAAGAAKA